MSLLHHTYPHTRHNLHYQCSSKPCSYSSYFIRKHSIWEPNWPIPRGLLYERADEPARFPLGRLRTHQRHTCKNDVIKEQSQAIILHQGVPERIPRRATKIPFTNMLGVIQILRSLNFSDFVPPLQDFRASLPLHTSRNKRNFPWKKSHKVTPSSLSTYAYVLNNERSLT